MKKTIVLIFTLAVCSGMLTAQKSQYFTYDRERVDREMAMVTEATVTMDSFDLITADSAKTRKIPNQAFFIIGLGSGCLGILAGYYVGYKLNVPNLAYVGGGIGILVPALIVGLRSRQEVTDPTKTPEEIAGIKAENRKNVARTAGGGIAAAAGCAVVAGVVAVIIVYAIVEAIVKR